jgi:hypothetical protein
MSEKLGVERRPCSSCPYRVDVPASVWHHSEYDKLLDYDQPTYAQPTMLFLCHHSAVGESEKLCRGWVDCHGTELLALRLRFSELDDSVGAALDEGPQVPVHLTGAAAAEHGKGDADERAVEMSARLLAQHPRLTIGDS